MALDAVSGRVFRDVAIPGLTDIATNQSASDSSGNKQFPSLTPAQSAANAAAAGADVSKTSTGDPLTKAAGGSLDKNAFLKLLVQEMTNQDPLKPADNTQFIAQLAQFSTLEQMQNLNTGFTNLQTSFQISQARGLLGVAVQAVNSSTGVQVNGTVDQIMVDADGSVRLDVGGTAVNVGDVISIGAGAPAGSGSSSPNSGTPLPGTLVPPTNGTGTSTSSGTGH
jgi:flagellar basal-body rod modification protein FlgD